MRWEGIAHLIIIWNLGIINVIIIIISMWSQSFSFRKENILVLILFSSRVIERDSIARIKPYFFCVASFIFLLEAFRSQREPDMNGKAADFLSMHRNKTPQGAYAAEVSSQGYSCNLPKTRLHHIPHDNPLNTG